MVTQLAACIDTEKLHQSLILRIQEVAHVYVYRNITAWMSLYVDKFVFSGEIIP
jgi:hypothetical protein